MLRRRCVAGSMQRWKSWQPKKLSVGDARHQRGAAPKAMRNRAPAFGGGGAESVNFTDGFLGKRARLHCVPRLEFLLLMAPRRALHVEFVSCPEVWIRGNARGVAFPFARSAMPTRSAVRGRYDTGVFRSEFVPSDAVRFCGVQTAGPDAAKDVITPRDRFQMGRVDARPVAAEVVKVEALRDRTDQKLVRTAVGISSHSGPSIAVLEMARPFPALIVAVGGGYLTHASGERHGYETRLCHAW